LSAQVHPLPISRESIHRAVAAVRPSRRAPEPESARWSNVLGLRPGRRIIVTTDDRPASFRAVFASADPDSLAIDRPNGARERLPRTSIERIVIDGKTDEWKAGVGLLV